MRIVEFASRSATSIKARPANCDASIHDADAAEKVRKLCPNCNQFHLRPGYCQALDPINAGEYPQSQKAVSVETKSHENETETENETGIGIDESQPWVAEGISRATYFRRKRSL